MSLSEHDPIVSEGASAYALTISEFPFNEFAVFALSGSMSRTPNPSFSHYINLKMKCILFMLYKYKTQLIVYP